MTAANAKRKPTLADVAKLAGTSKTAVSSVLNNGRGKTTRVGEETALLIRDAAKRLGYRANLTAQSLATGRTGFIGFMLSSTVSRGFLNAYFAGYLEGVEAECRRQGYGLAVACAPISEAGSFIRSDILSQRRIDALIVAGELDTGVYAELKSSKLPFLVLNAMRCEGMPVIDTMAIGHAISYAVGRGFRRMAVTRDAISCDQRYPLLEAALAKARQAGVEVEFVAPSAGEHPNWEPGFGLGRHLFERWQAKPSFKRADLLVSNGVLVEFYAELAKAGLKCPQDVSLLGDNDYNFFNSHPVFSRLRIDHAEAGSDAVKLLLEAIAAGGPVSCERCAALKYEPRIVEGETLK
jgi:DNA-binding LacI/PurR family transcriptional regulator